MRFSPVSPLALALCAALAASTAACGDDGADGSGGGGSTTGQTTTSTGESTTASTGTGDCLGVLENGVCVGKCSPDTCLPGNTCVGNRCVLTCESHSDCYAGSACAEATEDDTGATVLTCQPSGKAAILGATCFFGNECDAVTVCPDGTPCGASLCGGQACTDGACPDGTPCAPQTCDAAACRSPRCIGAVEGADQSPSGQAYCTQDDCAADADCAPGMYCGKTRDFHEICGQNIELGSETPCIDPDEFTTDGKTFQEGPVSLLRNTCLWRRQCAPCETDADCGGIPGQLCAEIGGEQRCAQLCATDDDCERDAACLEDPAHPGSLVCTPRYGSCTGEGEFCAPCVNDLDCGGPETSMICYPLAGSMRGCFDFSFENECQLRCPDGTLCGASLCDGEDCGKDGLCPDGRTKCTPQSCAGSSCRGSDMDCPLSVNGVNYGECLDSGEGVNSSSPDFLKCFMPYFSGVNRFMCW